MLWKASRNQPDATPGDLDPGNALGSHRLPDRIEPVRRRRRSTQKSQLLFVIVFESTMSPWVRRALLVAAIIVVLLPLVELGDHWETYGSDPEFVTVITVAAICLGFLLFRRDVVCALRRLVTLKIALREVLRVGWSPSLIIQDESPPIRAPIRI